MAELSPGSMLKSPENRLLTRAWISKQRRTKHENTDGRKTGFWLEKSEDFDSTSYVGGDGPMWDLADNPDSMALLAARKAA
jgi:hypothetical protein